MENTISEDELLNNFEKICELIEEGHALRNILVAKNPYMSKRQFFKLISTNEAAREHYAYSCEVRAEIIFEDMLEIADDGTNDLMTIERGNKEYNVENKEVTNRSRLRIDTRKWYLSKLMPKKFGEKVDLSGEIQNKVRYIIDDGEDPEDE